MTSFPGEHGQRSASDLEALHTIRNQLGLISGQSSLLEMHPGLDEQARTQCREITEAVFEISRALKRLGG